MCVEEYVCEYFIVMNSLQKEKKRNGEKCCLIRRGESYKRLTQLPSNRAICLTTMSKQVSHPQNCLHEC